MSFKITTHSPEETIAFAQKFAKHLKKGDIICLQGDLGAGKTTMVKGLAKAFGIKPTTVTSPTFVIMNCYEGKVPIYHFDFYRLETPSEISTVQCDDYFYGDGVSIVEWPERLGVQMPKEYFLVELQHHSEANRVIAVRAVGDVLEKRLARMKEVFK